MAQWRLTVRGVVPWTSAISSTDRLAAADRAAAELVKLRYFAGLSLPDAAAALGISPATAKRHWVYARSWIYGKLHGR